MQIKLLNILNELEIKKPLWRPFNNKAWEQGKNIKETIINFLKANPYQPGSVIVNNLPYHNKFISDTISKMLKFDIKRIKVKSPITKREVFVYYIPKNNLSELEINNPNKNINIIKDINEYFNYYFIKWLQENSPNIDEDVQYYLPKHLDDIKNIMSRDNQFEHNQFDDDMAEEYFNLNMLDDVKKKLWKLYFQNINIKKIKDTIYDYIIKYGYDDYNDEGTESFFKWNIDNIFDEIFDEIYTPTIIEEFIDDVIYKTISNYEPDNDLN